MMPLYTILFPTDFSETAQKAFPLACSLARDSGARVIALHVLPPALGNEEMEARHHPEEHYGIPMVALHKLQAPTQDVHVEHRLEEGNATKVILDVAQEAGAGMIVMGTQGRTGLPRLLLGSVAEQVLRKASCPVLTVRLAAVSAVPSGTQPSLMKPADLVR
jgi:nucleotide-binding universal stress UspA family protein